MDELTLVRVKLSGVEYELHALHKPKYGGLYFACVFVAGRDCPVFEGKTLHPLPQFALTEAFSAALDITRG